MGDTAFEVEEAKGVAAAPAVTNWFPGETPEPDLPPAPPGWKWLRELDGDWSLVPERFAFSGTRAVRHYWRETFGRWFGRTKTTVRFSVGLGVSVLVIGFIGVIAGVWEAPESLARERVIEVRTVVPADTPEAPDLSGYREICKRYESRMDSNTWRMFSTLEYSAGYISREEYERRLAMLGGD